MKRIVTLALAAGLFMGATAQTAEAVEVSVDGKMVFGFYGYNGLNLKENNGSQNNTGFDVWQRFQLGINFVASETLSGRFMFRAPNETVWGVNDFDVSGYTPSNGSNFSIKEAYVDWIIPTTDISVRMGMQYFNTPYMLKRGGAPIMDDWAPGVTVDVPVNEWFDFNVAWARVDSANIAGGNDMLLSTDDGYADYFQAVANFNFDGMSFIPYFAFATVGAEASLGSLYQPTVPAGKNYSLTSDYDAYYAGLNMMFTVFDPLTIAADFLYAWADGHNGNEMQANAWMADLALSYNTGNGAVTLFGWYATGDDAEDVADGEYGRILSLSEGWGTAKSAFFNQEAYGIGPNSNVGSPTGTWAVGLEYDGYRPIEDLRLGGHVLWINGTNDADLFNNPAGAGNAAQSINPKYMSTEDSVIDITAWAVYDIYKEFQVCFDVSYLIANFEEDNYDDEEENGFRAGLSFQYTF